MLASWDWCITHKEDNPAYPITAINISWGDYTHNTSQCDGSYEAEALVAASCKAAGIAIFAAAGNENLCDGMPMPACLSDVISVGAVYDENGSTMSYCLPYQACSSWPSSSCGGWACRDDVVVKDQVSCCSNSAGFLTLLAPCGGYTSGSAPTPRERLRCSRATCGKNKGLLWGWRRWWRPYTATATGSWTSSRSSPPAGLTWMT